MNIREGFVSEKWRSRIERTSDFTGSWAAVMLSIMAVFIFVCVIMRYVFNMPWLMSDEIVRYLNASGPVLGMALCMKERRHIRVDLIYSHLHGKVRQWLEVSSRKG